MTHIDNPSLVTTNILADLQVIQYKAMSRSYSLEELLPELLKLLLKHTHSENGIIGAVYKKDNVPTLKIHAFEVEENWRYNHSEYIDKYKTNGFEICNPQSIFGWLIEHKEILITDDLQSHPASKGYPSYHPRINSCVAVPLLFKNDMVGLIAISNDNLNISDDFIEKLKPIFATGASIIRSIIELDQKDVVEAMLRRFKFALDESSIVAKTNVKGEITYVNDKFLSISKYKKDELIGKNHNIINSGYHDVEFFRDMWKTIANGNIWKGIVKNRAKDGTFYWVDSTIIPFLDKNGKPYEYLAIRNDITQQKIIEDKLKQQNKDLDQFAYIASHDLKAPLRGIASLIDFLEEDLPQLDENCKMSFGLIKSRVKRLNGIIDGLLEYSRVGNAKENIGSVDTHKMVNEIIASLNFPDNVSIRIEKTLPTIIISDVLLYHILQNIITNAVKHNDKDEIIVVIDYNEQNNWYTYKISDNGTGIPEHLRERVFNIFQTLKTKDQLESSGIGLAIVKKIISKLGGTITIGDSKLGGSIFEFTIPKLNPLDTDND